MFLNRTALKAVVAAILLQLSSVQARPLPVADTDSYTKPQGSGSNSQKQKQNDDNQNNLYSPENVFSSPFSGYLQSVSIKDACIDASIACIDDLLVVCMNGRWNRDDRYTRRNRKRSKIQVADVSCASSESHQGSTYKYSDSERKREEDKNYDSYENVGEYDSNYSYQKSESESTVVVYSTPAYYSTVVTTTTTLAPGQAKEEISRLIRSAASTVHYTSTQTPCSSSASNWPSSAPTPTPTPTPGGHTYTDADCDDYEVPKSSTDKDEYKPESESYPATHTIATIPYKDEYDHDYHESSSTYSSLTPSTTSPVQNETGPIINIRLTTMPLIIPTATSNSSVATPSARIDNAGDAIGNIRLTTVEASPTSTPARY
ncbi:hypothetical protein L218DRAFT_956437 [Marasmius fiardii PR-910]|nr:hypothetical protein L218DRAFT_956437 [Marasmius fiardii PR-910]